MGNPSAAVAPGVDVRQAIDEGAMSRFQVLAVAVCVTLNMLDGFDVLVMAFTAPEVAREWGLSGARLGVLLSAGLFGMAGALMQFLWSPALGVLSDRYGRRRTGHQPQGREAAWVDHPAVSAGG